jgi:putative NADPH-quinone reductase
MKKVLVILGHPRLESFNAALASSYIEGAQETEAEVKQLDLARLEFASDSAAAPDYDNRVKEIEPSLKEAQELIRWADHLVFIYPTFWGDMPALLKGFIDRAFLPNLPLSTARVHPCQINYLKEKLPVSPPPWTHRFFGTN